MTVTIRPAPGQDRLFNTQGVPGVDRPPVAVSYGMGVDSTALLVGLRLLDSLPDIVQTADTGSEKPDTYQYLFLMDDWLHANGFPTYDGLEWVRPPGYEEFDLPERRSMRCIAVVRNDGKYGTLEKKNMLPSLAYGGRSCSEKYKHRPMHKWMKAWPPARLWWGLNNRNQKGTDRFVIKLIGYDAGEGHRSDVSTDDFYQYLYPLRLWGWHRRNAEAVILTAGLPLPFKSSCTFCPAMKKPEIVELGNRYPTLLQRALDMEQAAAASGNLKSVKGLARNWAWRDFVADQEAQGKFQKTTLPMSLGCVCQPAVYEGEGADADEEECPPVPDGDAPPSLKLR
jgi:hypothetical protein